jgi:hypothetical protein
MSTISGIGGQSTITQLQRLMSQRTQSKSDMAAQFEEAAEKAGVDLTQFEGLRDKVQSAVEEVIANYDGTSETELAEQVESTVNQVLSDNGVDTAEVQDQLAAIQAQLGQNLAGMGGAQGGPPPGGPPPGGPPPGGPPPTGAVSDTESTSTEDILAALTGSTSTSETEDTDELTFEELLDELEQIQQDQEDQQKQQTEDDYQAARLANMIATALFGPAIDLYA